MSSRTDHHSAGPCPHRVFPYAAIDPVVSPTGPSAGGRARADCAACADPGRGGSIATQTRECDLAKRRMRSRAARHGGRGRLGTCRPHDRTMPYGVSGRIGRFPRSPVVCTLGTAGAAGCLRVAETSVGEASTELGPRPDPELPVRAREVGLDGLRADEQSGGNLAIRHPGRREGRDPGFGRRQSVATSAGAPEVSKFRAGRARPPRGPDLFEPADGFFQRCPSIPPAAEPALMPSDSEQRPRRVVGQREPGVCFKSRDRTRRSRRPCRPMPRASDLDNVRRQLPPTMGTGSVRSSRASGRAARPRRHVRAR